MNDLFKDINNHLENEKASITIKSAYTCGKIFVIYLVNDMQQYYKIYNSNGNWLKE